MAAGSVQGSELTQQGYELTLERAIELHAAGGYEAAIQIYRSLLQDRPDDARLLFELARASLAIGDGPACVDSAAKNLMLSMDAARNAAALNVLAMCHEITAPAAADATYRSALTAHPNDPRLHSSYALALEKRGDTLAAEFHLGQALKHATAEPELFLEHAARLENDGNVAGALLLRLRFIMIEPQSPTSIVAAEQILAALDGEAPGSAPHGYELALRRAIDGATASGRETPAARSNAILRQFILNALNDDSLSTAEVPLWVGGMEPLLTLAEHDVLDAYLYFVGALARAEGSPQWLSLHREKFERLVQFLAQAG